MILWKKILNNVGRPERSNLRNIIVVMLGSSSEDESQEISESTTALEKTYGGKLKKH